MKHTPTKPRLPETTADAWPGGFCVESPKYVGAASAGRGFVVLAGEATYLLRPGAAGFRVRAWSADEGDLVAAAVEPRARARFAVGSMDTLVVFDGDAIGKVKLGDEDRELRALAWGHEKLYVLFDDGHVMRVTPDTSDIDELELEGASALANDDQGNVGIACMEEDGLRVFVSGDGLVWHHRSVELPDFVSGGVHLAIAGMAAAVSFQLAGSWISRGRDAPFLPCEALGTSGGPLAFQGGSDDAPLLGVVSDPGGESIVRIEGDGARSLVIARLETTGDEGPRVRALAWDESRRTLWGAAGHAGVFRSSPPGAGTGVMTSLS